MLNNLLYLVDTQRIDLMVTLFIMTINNNGNIILRFVAEQGSLLNLKNFNTSDAYLAVKNNEYQDENSEFVKSILPEYAIESIVVATIVNGEKEKDLKPFGISILKNNMALRRPKINPISNNDSVVLATINSANVKASNNIATIISGDKNNCTYMEFYEKTSSTNLEMAKITLESEIELVNINIVKEKIKSIFGDIINYKNKEFDEEWRKIALNTLGEFFLEDNINLIPRLDGLWYEKYIEGESFPYWIIGQEYNKKAWIRFLSDKRNFPVNFRNSLKAS